MQINSEALPGTCRPVRGAARGFRPALHRTGGTVTTSDATARRTLRGALRDLLTREGEVGEAQVDAVFARISDATLTGMVLCDREKRIVHANDHFCRLVGRPREDLMGKPVAQYVGESVARWCRSGAGRERFEAEVRHPSGAQVVVEVAAEPIRGGRGSIVGCFGVLIDITARADALRRSETEVRLLSAQFMAAQELERQRIARELHDSVSQALGSIKFSLENCATQIAAGATDGAANTMRQVSVRIQAVVEELRRISMNLRPSTLDDLGVLATLAWFTREFRAIYQQLNIDVRLDVKEEEIAVPVKTAIYRIVQEAFNNVVSHSGARNVLLSLRRAGGAIELRVQDDGAGFQPGEFVPADDGGRGLGLASMRERAELTGGRFALHAAAGAGTSLTVHWPIYGARATPA
jgi:PAS domain S-box-containing protein